MYRLGERAAISLSLIGFLYLCVTTYGILQVGLNDPITGTTLKVMELLTLLSAPILVFLFAAIYVTTSSTQKVFALAALAFIIITAGLTSVVHFLGLTVLNQAGEEALVWPSQIYAIELLAWDIFLGLGLISLSFIYIEHGLRRKIRIGLILVGVLCIAGAAGPLSGEMLLQFLAVICYGVLLPGLWIMIAIDFRKLGKKNCEVAS